jgi:hypothetical protein
VTKHGTYLSFASFQSLNRIVKLILKLHPGSGIARLDSNNERIHSCHGHSNLQPTNKFSTSYDPNKTNEEKPSTGIIHVAQSSTTDILLENSESIAQTTTIPLTSSDTKRLNAAMASSVYFDFLARLSLIFINDISIRLFRRSKSRMGPNTTGTGGNKVDYF